MYYVVHRLYLHCSSILLSIGSALGKLPQPPPGVMAVWIAAIHRSLSSVLSATKTVRLRGLLTTFVGTRTRARPK